MDKKPSEERHGLRDPGWRRAHWQALVQEYEQSEQSVKSFCEERGVKYDTFLWWRRRLKGDSSAGFVEVCLPEVQAEYSLRLSNGRELVLRGPFRAERVAQLIALLEGANV